jgi:hypothetical protein
LILQRKLMRRLFQVGAIVALLFTGNSEAGQKIGMGVIEDGVPIRFDCELPFNELPPTGFYPVRFRIENGTPDSHTWEVTFSSSGSGSESRAMTWGTSLTVAGGQSREWDLLIPRSVLDSPGTRYEFVRGMVRGYGVSGNGNFGLPSKYIGGSKTAFTVVSDTLGNASWSKLEAEVKTLSAGNTKNSELVSGRFSSMGRGGRILSGSSVTLSELPPDWRAFSGLASLWMTQRDWETLSSERRRAIRTWLNMGGQLYVGTDTGALAKAPLLPEGLQAGKAVALGLGEIKTFKLEGGELPIAETAKEVMALDGTLFPAWHQDFARDWSLVAYVGWPKLNVPLIIGFVCLFGLVIGPINLRLMAPPEKRHRLFLTVPLISIGASILLGLVIAVGDGFGGFGGRNALVYLPAGENQAFITQEQIARTRLLVGRSFEIPETVQLAAADTKRPDERSSLERYGNSVSGDWFRSRAVQAHSLRAVVPTRAEIILQTPTANGAPSLLSSIGSPLQNVFYIDLSGKYWRADVVETGKPTPLRPSTQENFEMWQNGVQADMSDHMSAALSSAAKRPGYFYGMTNTLPEAPLETLKGINWTKQNVICFGPVATGGAK